MELLKMKTESATHSLLEQLLLDQVPQSYLPNPIFILGSPRTGSTFLYQVMADIFELPFISNLTNTYFAENPIVGLALQRSMDVRMKYQSNFGKIQGELQPSEGSAVITRWFGGNQPSQTESTHIIDGQEEHFLETLAAVEWLYSEHPLLIKNAWNCFRVPYLSGVLKNARFVWIRRDIAATAESDLEARYITKGSAALTWNSATPSNWRQLQQLPAYQQVVENQFEFNKAIKNSLMEYAKGRYIEVWYEDLVRAPAEELRKVGDFLQLKQKKALAQGCVNEGMQPQIFHEEVLGVHDYLKDNNDRFKEYQYARN
jgi:hypothetical protein